MRVHNDVAANGDVPKQAYGATLKVMNNALAAERTRDWDSQRPKLSDDPDVAQLQKQLDLPRPMAEQAVKERRRRVIAEIPSPSDKVQ